MAFFQENHLRSFRCRNDYITQMPPFCFHYLPSFFVHYCSQNKISVLPEGGGGATSYKQGNRDVLLDWGRIFTTWIDYNGVAFPIELLEWGRTFSGLWRSENSGRQGFKNGKIFTMLSLTNVSIHFKMTQLTDFLSQMHNQKCG